jgi:hypothetical protein
MDLYVGNVEKWKEFFKQFPIDTNIAIFDDMNHLMSNQLIKSIEDINDFINADVSAIFNNINKFKNFGKINKRSSFFWYRDYYMYSTTMECVVENVEHYIEDMRDCNIQKYKNFNNYNVNKNNINNRLNDVHKDYIGLLEKSYVLSNDEAYHEVLFVPCEEYCEVWLMESSAGLYRFRCFAELVVVHIMASHLNYKNFNNVTISDLEKYNAGLILNLDLLQQSDLPMK